MAARPSDVYSSSSSSPPSHAKIDDGGIRYQPLCCGNVDPAKFHELRPLVSQGEIASYDAQIQASDGFDIENCPNAMLMGYGIILPITEPMHPMYLQLVPELAKEALNVYNQKVDGPEHEFIRVIKANAQAIAGTRFYITFEVRRKYAPATEIFQAMVIYGIRDVVTVELCRPKWSPSSGFDNRPQHDEDDYSRLYDEDGRIYCQQRIKSKGFDVPELPNSSRVPNIVRPMKNFTPYCVEMLNDCSERALDCYNLRKGTNCKFVKFLKVNKQAVSDGNRYFITLVAEHNDGRFQTLQAMVICKNGKEPNVELCRAKPGAPMMEHVPNE